MHTCSSTTGCGTVLGCRCRRDHRPGKGLAYVFRRCQGQVFLKRKALLEPFRITHYHTTVDGIR